MKSLLAVEATSRHASFSAAAEELNVSQSAISHAVTAAEAFLGVQLIDRTTRPISLTTEGKIYMATLRNCLNQLATESDALRRSKTRNALTISCNLANANYWLLPRLKLFHLEYPKLQVHLVTTYQGLASLDDGIDIAVRFGDGNWPNCTSHLLFRERIVPVASPDYLERNPPVHQAADLLDHTLLHAMSLERSWYDWNQWFEQFGLLPSAGLPGPSFDNHLLMMQAALNGRGVALGWIGTAYEFIRQGQLVKVIDLPVILREGLYVVIRNRHDPQIECFVDWITSMTAAEAETLRAPF
ncbi:LysR substrate-binding domain-containing protein [Mesorhizobium sp. YC-39]|uniref:LysR substrate-binding domain-containing protein n=1 Tax=unclassified Mesorhizobium TaxID=325217 RepID=UPI0021E8DB3A|nr:MULTISPECIES: LysR substrate-binding domain-containing protein [unclassified Mesorhizobium]MCV3211692.1 LysR substrate-binding domain-containing protein [Mesorhizobium sp. YC-2]MCV3233404.1 LysR substrate-binding domain-containing protein [Mesorhizobium sp. YC-39]